MKTFIAAALAATTLSAVAAPAADIVKTLQLSDQTAAFAQQIPAAVGEFAVKGPIYTRQLVGYDYSGDSAVPVYGAIKGVVQTRDVVGYDYSGDTATPILGDAKGLAFGLSLTPEQAFQRELDSDSN